MPIYGYACKECGHQLDALQRMSDPPLTDCPECGRPALKRQLSAPRFRLKGQGWYETDFKKDGQRNLAGDGDAAKADAKADGKAEARTEAKAEGKGEGKSDAAPEKPAADKPDKPGKPAKAAKPETKSAPKATGSDAG
ncbi:MAG TPA: FmdB family zinc ribbon protein [Woeseiaceae bacterium]|nr:FmdB family zinc ribbon protein [Woeseiaceae bacterium]